MTMIFFAAEAESQHVQETATNNNYSAIIFAVVSLIIYVLFLRPTTDNTNSNNNDRRQAAQAMAGGGASRTAAAARRRGNERPAAAAPVRPQQPVARAKPMSDAVLEVLSKCQAKPPHVRAAIGPNDMKIGGSNVLVDGLVGFAATQASTCAEQDAAAKRNQLKERAKILSQLFKTLGVSAMTTPPAKGANLVFGVSEKQLEGEEGKILSKVVANLATNYTLLLIVQVDDSNQNGKDFASTKKTQEKVVQQIRQHPSLSEAILSSHRILLSNLATGRVALVRQMSTVELMVDFDPDVQTQLERFGYKVAVPEWKSSFSWILAPAS